MVKEEEKQMTKQMAVAAAHLWAAAQEERKQMAVPEYQKRISTTPLAHCSSQDELSNKSDLERRLQLKILCIHQV